MTLSSAQGAGGTFYYQFEVRNTGEPCAVGGYFGVSVYDPAGQPISASDRREPTSIQGGPVRSVLLPRGGRASFTVGLVDVNCRASSPKIGAFHLIPPNATTFDQVSTNHGFQYCGPSILVYPTEPGAPKA